MTGIGQSGVVFGVHAQETGVANVQNKLRGMNSELKNVSLNTQKVGLSFNTMGESSRAASATMTKSMNQISQVTFRYTFYAMMALRVGQMLLARVFTRGMSKAAEEYEVTWSKMRGILHSNIDAVKELQHEADRLALTTPFGPIAIGEAMLSATQAGLDVANTMGVVAGAVDLATLSESNLDETTRALITTVNAFNLEMSGSGEVVKQMAYFANRGLLQFDGFVEVLAKVGATAHGANQSLADTLQLAQLLAKSGAPQGEIGTLQRQLYMALGKADVQTALQAGLHHYGLGDLYDEAGRLTNIPTAYVAFSKMLEEAREAAEAAGRGSEFGQMYDVFIREMFGVREGRGFKALASRGFDEVEEMFSGDYAEMMARATEDLDARLLEVTSTLRFTKLQLTAVNAQFAVMMGHTINIGKQQFIRAWTEVVATINALVATNNLTRTLVPSVLAMTASFIGLAGALGLVAGVFMLIKTRLADLGSQLGAVELNRLLRLRRLGDIGTLPAARTLQAANPALMGRKYMMSWIAGPMKILGTLMLVGGFLTFAWQRNLWGLREHTQKFTDWWSKHMSQTGSVGVRLAEKLRKAFDNRFFRALGKEFGEGGAFDHIGVAFVEVIVAVGRTIKDMWPIVRFFGKVLSGVGILVSGILGFGNAERGMRNISRYIAFITSVTIIKKLSMLFWTLSVGVAKLLGFGKGGLAIKGLAMAGRGVMGVTAGTIGYAHHAVAGMMARKSAIDYARDIAAPRAAAELMNLKYGRSTAAHLVGRTDWAGVTGRNRRIAERAGLVEKLEAVNIAQAKASHPARRILFTPSMRRRASAAGDWGSRQYTNWGTSAGRAARWQSTVTQPAAAAGGWGTRAGLGAGLMGLAKFIIPVVLVILAAVGMVFLIRNLNRLSQERRASASNGASGDTYSIHVTVPAGADANEIGETVVSCIQKLNRDEAYDKAVLEARVAA